jgi:glycosyltransferase involved in cell wall biosynthesis
MGFAVSVFALSAPGFPDKTCDRGIQIRRFSLATRSWPKTKIVQLIKYVEVLFRMFFAGALFRPLIVHAHDVDALPIGYLIASITKAKLIYDAHEIWADPAHAQAMPKWLAKGIVIIERIFARRADECITVSESIAQHMATHQQIRTPVVIRNVPEPWPDKPPHKLRTALGIPDNKVVILYQGNIGGEGVKILAHAFRQVQGDAVLVFLGDGPAVPHLQADLADMKSQVRFHPLVSSEELPSFTSDADIGVHPMAGGCLNHLWALPNKLFEYIQGGLAVATSELPEMANVIRRHGIGLTFPPGDVDGLAQCLQILINDSNLRNNYRQAAREAAKQLNWAIERENLKAVYEAMDKGK